MKQRPLFVICLIFGVAILASAQAKRVTNADLERYRTERVKAEQDYRENYAKMGFSSPEELERRREQSRIETERMSAKLRSERLERERFEAEQQMRADMAASYYYNSQAQSAPQEPWWDYATGWPGYYGSGRRRFAGNSSIYGSRPGRNGRFGENLPGRVLPIFPSFNVPGRVRPVGPAFNPGPVRGPRR